jgi:hypothetical protein
VLTPAITTMLVCDKWLADAALSMALTVVSPG